MNKYEDMIKKSASKALAVAAEIEKSASVSAKPKASKPIEKKSFVQHEVEKMLSKVAGEEDIESDVLPDEVLASLGLGDYLIANDEEEEIEDQQDAEEEAQDDAQDEEDEEDEEEKVEAIKEAQEYFLKALALEKEATEAFNEAQVWKIASLRILNREGKIDNSTMEKVASMTYDEIIK